VASVVLAVVGGLLVVGGTVGDWVVIEVMREVGDVVIRETRRTSGAVYAPGAIPLGVLAVMGAPLVAWSRARRIAGLALLAVALAAAAQLAVGAARAAAARGPVASGAVIAGAGAACVGASGVLALRRRRGPREESRYTVEGFEDREWELAADDEPKRLA
jgi:hypothetical protein